MATSTTNGHEFPPAPSDRDADRAWDRIADTARRYCLVVEASAGTMLLATPEAQRSHPGVRARVLRMHRRTEAGDG